MQISASIYSDIKRKSLEELIRQLDAHETDMFHVDCMDNEKIFSDIREIRKISSTPIDLHIIASKPEKYFPLIEELKVEYVSFQYENLDSLPLLPIGTGTKFGLSLASDTPINVFEKAVRDYSFVTIMTTVPGMSGGVFRKENFQKILAFKNRFPKTRIHVDGGVNDEIGFILRLLGAHVVVTGNYLMNHENMGAGMLSFHKSGKKEKSLFHISDFATPIEHLPVLKNHSNFITVLQTIEAYKLGFVLLTGNDGKLESVITNADIRRGLLKNSSDFNSTSIADLINRNPITIPSSATVSEMIRLVNELNFIVLFLPVVDENKTLKGAVLLNNLTRI